MNFNNIELISNKNNFILGNNTQITDYKKFHEKEVTNKIKYELEKDLINKQKESYNIKFLSSKKKSLDNKEDKKRNKLTLLDLEEEQDKEIKDIENMLCGGITDIKLRQLEEKYKDNKEVIEMINAYKSKKNTIENNNINNINFNTNNSNNFNESSNSVQINNKIKPSIYKNKHSKINNYTDLSPFYYISNGNKASNNMWGYNDKIKYRSGRNKSHNINKRNELSREEIIQNKLRIYKDKISKPFMEKIEKEKMNEYKRIQVLNKINDPTIKENLETKFAIERGKIDMELTREKEKINKAIKSYEESLLQSENLNNISPKSNIFFE